MKTQEIRELSAKDLKERIETEKTNLLRVKMNHAISPLENPLVIRSTRKNVARLATEINKRKNK